MGYSQAGRGAWGPAAPAGLWPLTWWDKAVSLHLLLRNLTIPAPPQHAELPPSQLQGGHTSWPVVSSSVFTITYSGVKKGILPASPYKYIHSQKEMTQFTPSRTRVRHIYADLKWLSNSKFKPTSYKNIYYICISLAFQYAINQFGKVAWTPPRQGLHSENVLYCKWMTRFFPSLTTKFSLASLLG